MPYVMQGGPSDSHVVAREAWQDLKGDVQHALPLAQAKLLQGIQSYYAELDVQSVFGLDYLQHLVALWLGRMQHDTKQALNALSILSLLRLVHRRLMCSQHF